MSRPARITNTLCELGKSVYSNFINTRIEYTTLRTEQWHNHEPLTPLVVYHKDFKKSMEDTTKMKFLSVGEFKSLCNKLSPNEIIITSDNQTDVSESGMKCSIVFDSITIHLNPNSVFLKSKNNSYIKLDRVKHIKKRENSLLGNVFDIICGGFIDPDKEFLYTIIVR